MKVVDGTGQQADTWVILYFKQRLGTFNKLTRAIANNNNKRNITKIRSNFNDIRI